jgi:uncharacterized protein (TIGR02145 family)
MKNKFTLLSLSFLIACMITFSACTKDDAEIPAITTPAIITTAVSVITTTSAITGGVVTNSGSSEVTARGVCWSTAHNPTVADNETSEDLIISLPTFPSTLIGLIPATTYYVRAYATNSAGTVYGNELIFTTSAISSIDFNPDLTYGTVSDIEGNIYKTIQVGTQVWMAENLKTTKYNDGTPIDNVTGFTEWSALTTGAYCWYGNDGLANKNSYGALYNWFAVNTSKLCPKGWHVPSSEEWNTLKDYLGGADIAGGKLKETGNTHWSKGKVAATNSSGFTALPAGTRNVFGDPEVDDFRLMNLVANWWSASQYQSDINRAIYFIVEKDVNFLIENSLLLKQSGYSVRCVKDN